MSDNHIRHVARAVVVDRNQSVLLVRYDHWDSAANSYWVPPGGALEPDENHRQAASRELTEETGLSNLAVGPFLWERSFRYQPFGRATHQVEQYFLFKLDLVAPAVRNNSTEQIEEHRWWTLAELRETKDTIFPEGLAFELEQLFLSLRD